MDELPVQVEFDPQRTTVAEDVWAKRIERRTCGTVLGVGRQGRDDAAGHVRPHRIQGPSGDRRPRTLRVVPAGSVIVSNAAAATPVVALADRIRAGSQVVARAWSVAGRESFGRSGGAAGGDLEGQRPRPRARHHGTRGQREERPWSAQTAKEYALTRGQGGDPGGRPVERVLRRRDPRRPHPHDRTRRQNKACSSVRSPPVAPPAVCRARCWTASPARRRRYGRRHPRDRRRRPGRGRRDQRRAHRAPSSAFPGSATTCRRSRRDCSRSPTCTWSTRPTARARDLTVKELREIASTGPPRGRAMERADPAGDGRHRRRGVRARRQIRRSTELDDGPRRPARGERRNAATRIRWAAEELMRRPAPVRPARLRRGRGSADRPRGGTPCTPPLGC